MKISNYFIIGLVLTLSMLWPLFVAPYFSHHDDVQVIRLFEMNNCIQDGQLPCRWVPNLGGLYGYPLFNYYAPLPYYFGEIIYLILGNLMISAKVMFSVSFVGSYIFMYLLGRKVWGEKGGVISGVFYSFAPYHAVDFYVRGAMGEMWALMFFPAIIWALFKLREKSNIGNALLLGFLIALLVLSHNLSSMVFMPIVLALALLFYLKHKNIKFIYAALFSLVLGLGLSAFYFLPAIVEKNLVHVDTTTAGYFSYTEHFKGLRKLFLDMSWGWGASVREIPGGEKDGMSFQIGIIHLLGWFFSLVAAKLLWKKDKFLSFVILFFSVVAIFSVFMINPKSEFMWKLIEPLKFLQFPWRFLMITIFGISLITGSVITLVDKKYRKVLWVVSLVLVVLLNFTYFRPEKFIQVTDKDYLQNPIFDAQIKRSIFDYLPIYAKAPPAELATVRYQILVGEGMISNFSEKSDRISFDAKLPGHTIIRLSQYYFPNWKITDNGELIKIDYDNDLGLMTILLGEGNHHIEAMLHDSLIRSVANSISGITFWIFVLLILLQSKRGRKNILYYLKAFYK